MVNTFPQWLKTQDPRIWLASLMIGLWLFVPPFSFSVGGGLASKEHFVRLLPFLIVLVLRRKWLRGRLTWFDLPVLLYCVCPLASGLANGLGLRFSLWQTVLECSYWLVPYWIGRTVFTADGHGENSNGTGVGNYRMVRGRLVAPLAVDHSRGLATVIVAGALVYLLPTLYEIFRGPVLTAWATGEAGVGQLRGAARGSTFKPSVFLTSGFVLTMFLVLASLIAACRAAGCLWDTLFAGQSGHDKLKDDARSADRLKDYARSADRLKACPTFGDRLGDYSTSNDRLKACRTFGDRLGGSYSMAVWLLTAAVLTLVVVGCRSLGSIALLAIGLAVIGLMWFLPRASIRWTLPILLGVLLLLPPLYMGLRITGIASAERISGWVEQVAPRTRAGSLEYRMLAEDAVFQRMTDHWSLGYGDFGRWRDVQPSSVVGDESSELPTRALDGFWLFAMTRTGFVSLAAWWVMMALPVFVFLRRWPRRFTDEGEMVGHAWIPGDAIAFTLFLSLSLIDSMVNYFGALPQMLLVGSVTGLIAGGERKTSGMFLERCSQLRFSRQWLYAVYLAMSLLLPIAAFGPQAADPEYFAEVVGTALPSGEFINRSTVTGLFAWMVAAVVCLITSPTRERVEPGQPSLARRASMATAYGARGHLPIVVWIACPLLSGLFNPSSLLVDAAQSLYLLLVWGGPYVMGCVVLGNIKRLQFSAQVILSAGFVSFLACMLEFFWGRFIYESLYGHHPYVTQGQTRYFGWRPLLMFEDPNQLGMWFATLSLTAVAWWRYANFARDGGMLWSWLTPGATRIVLVVNAFAVLWFQAIGASLLSGLGAAFMIRGHGHQRRGKAGLRIQWLLAAGCALAIGLFVCRGPILHYGRATLRTTPAGRQVTVVLKELSLGSLTWRLAREDDHRGLIGQHPIVGWGTVDYWRQNPDDVRPWGLVTLVTGAYGALGVIAWLSIPLVMIGRLWRLPAHRLELAWPLLWVVVLASIHTLDGFLNSGYLLAVVPLYGGFHATINRLS